MVFASAYRAMKENIAKMKMTLSSQLEKMYFRTVNQEKHL